MGKFTRKQKRVLRSFITGLSCCCLLAAILIYMQVSNINETVPVRFSDILEGASVTAPEADEPDLEKPVYEPEYLYETLYPTELLTLPQTTTAPVTTLETLVGAGGTLLLETTATTTPPAVTETETETTTEASVLTDTVTAEQTYTATYAPETTAPVPVTTTKATTEYTKRTTTKATTTPEQSTTSKTPFTNIGGGTISEDDTVYITMLNLVNQARVDNGLDKLWYSARLHEVSTLRAYELSSYYSHQRPNKEGFHTAFGDCGLTYRYAGENIAYGRNMFKEVEDVFEAWMNSPSHRENILNPNYDCVAFGLCTLKVGKDTYYYWDQEFARF